MKRLFTLLLIMVGFVLAAHTSFAQSDKQTAKEWKKKMKQMDPLAFKKVMDENKSYAAEVDDLTADVLELKNKLQAKDNQITDLQKKVSMLESEIANKKVVPTTTTTSASNGNWNQGVVFRVQIGAFRSKDWDLSKYFGASDNFSGEVDADGLKRYTLGNFRDYWEADKFKKYMRNMGVKDAWIVSYKDGKRVPMKDVLEGVI